jgi:hypothetical protein
LEANSSLTVPLPVAVRCVIVESILLILPIIDDGLIAVIHQVAPSMQNQPPNGWYCDKRQSFGIQSCRTDENCKCRRKRLSVVHIRESARIMPNSIIPVRSAALDRKPQKG